MALREPPGGTAAQHVKEGKNAINWTRLSCRAFRHNAVRLRLHALAFNLGNFLRTLALPKAVEHWSLTTLREKLVKIEAKAVSHGRYVTFQMAEAAVPREPVPENPAADRRATANAGTSLTNSLRRSKNPRERYVRKRTEGPFPGSEAPFKPPRVV